MDAEYLDELVKQNPNLVPLTRDSASEFVDKVNAFFKKPNLAVDYHIRYIQLEPPLDPKPWKEEGRISIIGAEFDLDDVHIEYVDGRQREDSIFIDLHTRAATAGYVFVPDVGLYLHDEVGIDARDHLLIFPK